MGNRVPRKPPYPHERFSCSTVRPALHGTRHDRPPIAHLGTGRLIRHGVRGSVGASGGGRVGAVDRPGHRAMSGDDPGLATLGGLSRRRLFARAGAAAGALAAAPLLAACAETTRPAAVGSSAWWAGQRRTGHLVFANWPLYI